MKEFKQFTHKQLGIIIAIAIMFIIAGFSAIQLIIFVFSDETKAEARTPKVYQVMHQDEDGYYVAVEVVKTEDDSYVPLSFYEEDDKVIVYLDEDVQGRVPDVGELIKIRMNAYGEKPIVTPY